MFLTSEIFASLTWQAFERAVTRLLIHEGFDGVRLVGQTNDRGADVLGHRHGKRWVVQVKHWRSRVGPEVIDRTYDALGTYRAQVPVVVARSGFTGDVRDHQKVLLSEGVPLQLWDRPALLERMRQLEEQPLCLRDPERYSARDYQEEAIRAIIQTHQERHGRRAMVVMATGLGKTFVAAEAVRRLHVLRPLRVLAIAHTNELVYQLERSFWPFLTASQGTVVWNGLEHPPESVLATSPFVFACLPTVAAHIAAGNDLPEFDLLLIDECHHVGAAMYESVLGETRAGTEQGPFLLGLTATPWRPDETDLEGYFGAPVVSVDLVTGLRRGFLANVDYRMYTDNIDWEALSGLEGNSLSPRQINRTLFISQWDDAVVYELQSAWQEQKSPRAIVFCGTIEHALTMRDRINSLGFCAAEAIYSGSSSEGTMKPYERNKILCDFHDGQVNVVCAVDIFNEGVDVPDVNIIVFQRVTHSRRIFIQQLGRGLRLAPEKDKVIVLDFVSDIRRFAAGLELKDQVDGAAPVRVAGGTRISLPHTVTFRRVGGEDPQTETFLREWLEDVAAIEDAGEDVSMLKYPPAMPGSRV